ncbi:putative peroxin pex22-like protein [Phaeomoniella chlamydospora]|uniref:Putative peroxin pex22-like protein n=1 Tax=Phaeomoniella chlamydospora TaxID=158046 RepID=A0A0G2DVE7_PHACM|nr:putative peroxin pex22-like protein [Phaeomoniella chlamydospora]
MTDVLYLFSTTFGYWVPLAVTVTVATIGLAAWIWSERTDDDEESSEGEHFAGGQPPPGYASMSGGLPPGPMPGDFQGGPPPPGPMGSGAPSPFQGPPGTEGEFARSTGVEVEDDGSLVGRMSGALRRAPSPQQSYDWASKKVAAGVAAAGAIVGGALSSIREGSQDDFEDHERWSEEADNRDNGPPKPKRRGTAHEFFEGQIDIPRQASISKIKRKSVAIVVSAVEHDTIASQVGQHASILSYLPHHIDFTTTRIFVLIYSPDIKQHPLSLSPTRGGGSLTSSYSNIAHEDATSQPGGDLSTIDPKPLDDTTSLFKALYSQSQSLVERDSLILPFTTPTGHLHILRSLAPETAYIQESLCGLEGDIVKQLSGWVKQIIVVVGDEAGHGGLVDSEDEVAMEIRRERLGESEGQEKWWVMEERTGLGRGVSVVDSLRVGEDWRRRIGEHD